MDSSNKVSKRKNIKGQQLYLVGYFLLILNQVLAQSQFNLMPIGEDLLKATRWGLILFFFSLVINKEWYPLNRKGLFWLFFLVITIVEMLFFDGRLLLLILLVLVIGSYKYNMEKIVKIHIFAIVTGIVFVFFCSLIGVLDIQGNEKELDNLTGFLFRTNNIRYNFGFTHFNIIPIALLYIYLYIVLLKREKYIFWYDLVALAVNFAVYMLSGSRSCILLVILAVMLRIIVALKPLCFIKIGTPISICILISALFFTMVYPMSNAFYTPIAKKIDLLLTARLSLMRRILTLFPLCLWGYGELNFDNSTEYLALDNGYITLFVTRGIIIGCAFMALLFALIIQAKEKNNPYELLFLIIMILGNLIDNSMLHYVTFPIYIMSFNDFIGDMDCETSYKFKHRNNRLRTNMPRKG